MKLILDSSVAFKSLVPETDSEKAVRLLGEYRGLRLPVHRIGRAGAMRSRVCGRTPGKYVPGTGHCPFFPVKSTHAETHP